MSIRALRSLAARLIGVCVTLMLASALHARDAEPRFAPDAVPIGRATEHLRKTAAAVDRKRKDRPRHRAGVFQPGGADRRLGWPAHLACWRLRRHERPGSDHGRGSPLLRAVLVGSLQGPGQHAASRSRTLWPS